MPDRSLAYHLARGQCKAPGRIQGTQRCCPGSVMLVSSYTASLRHGQLLQSHASLYVWLSDSKSNQTSLAFSAPCSTPLPTHEPVRTAGTSHELLLPSCCTICARHEHQSYLELHMIVPPQLRSNIAGTAGFKMLCFSAFADKYCTLAVHT